MPIFEYQCEECGTVFERLIMRPMSAIQIACPQCSSPRTAKVFSTFSTNAGNNPSAGRVGNSGFS